MINAGFQLLNKKDVFGSNAVALGKCATLVANSGVIANILANIPIKNSFRLLIGL
jgi:hypothetical protein